MNSALIVLRLLPDNIFTESENMSRKT